MKEKISKKNSKKKVPLPYFCQLLKKKAIYYIFWILIDPENKWGYFSAITLKLRKWIGAWEQWWSKTVHEFFPDLFKTNLPNPLKGQNHPKIA